MECKTTVSEEAILNLESIYLSNLSNFDVDTLELSEEAQEVRNIMEDWTGED